MQSALNRIWSLPTLLIMLLALSGCSMVSQLGDANAVPQPPTEVAPDESAELAQPAPQVEAVEESVEATAAVTESSDTTQFNTPEAEVEAEIAPTDNQTESTPVAEVAIADESRSNPPLGFISDDFTLVRNTGRPQFVYTFADW